MYKFKQFTQHFNEERPCGTHIDTPFMRAWHRTHAEHVRAERMKDWLVVLGTVAACEALIIAALVLVRG